MDLAFANLVVNPNPTPPDNDDPFASPPISRSNSNCDGYTNATATTPPQKPHPSPRNGPTSDCKKSIDEIFVTKTSGACNLIVSSDALNETTSTPTMSTNPWNIDNGKLDEMFKKGVAEMNIVGQIETLYGAKPGKLSFLDWMKKCSEDSATANPSWASVVGEACNNPQWTIARTTYVSAHQMEVVEKPFLNGKGGSLGFNFAFDR